MNRQTESQPESTFTPELLKVETVSALTTLGVRTIWRYAASGRMPAPVRLSRNVVRWRRRDIESWIADGCECVK